MSCVPFLQLSINAFDYNCHVDLIKLLRQEGKLHRLRKARQKMSELFPLTEGWTSLFCFLFSLCALCGSQSFSERTTSVYGVLAIL